MALSFSLRPRLERNRIFDDRVASGTTLHALALAGRPRKPDARQVGLPSAIRGVAPPGGSGTGLTLPRASTKSVAALLRGDGCGQQHGGRERHADVRLHGYLQILVPKTPSTSCPSRCTVPSASLMNDAA